MDIRFKNNIIQNSSVVARDIKRGEVLLVNYRRRDVLLLNFVGGFLWSLCAKPRSATFLIKKLQQKYNISYGQANKDLVVFFSYLLKEDFIVSFSKKRNRKKVFPEFSDELWDQIQPIAQKKQFPALAEIAVTENCNLSCVHCYVDKTGELQLSFQEIKRIIDQLAQAGCFFITFTGGEPFLRKDFLDIIKYARDKEFSVDILSNGNLITASIAKKLAEMNISRVQISIYSAIPKVHDSVTRINGSFEKSKKAIKFLHNNKIKVHIACLIMSLNFPTYKTVKSLVKKMSVTWSISYPVRARHSGEKDTYALRIRKEQLKKLLLENKKQLCQRFLKEKNEPVCHAGSAICFISANGNLNPCILFPLKLGNLKKEKLSDIWKNSNILKKFRKVKISDFINCKTCKFLEFCRLCPGINYLEEGDILKPAKIDCQLAKVVGRILNKKDKRV